MDGWYYLHENGDLIWKCFQPESEPGGFIKRVWAFDTDDRSNAWVLLIEALAAGALVDRVVALAQKWGCNGRDLVEFLVRHTPTEEQRDGLRAFLGRVLRVDPDGWFDWLASTPKGQKPDFDSMPTAA